MKALKVIGIIIGLLGLAVFVFWFGWLRAPATPEEVCAHLQAIASKEAGMPAPMDPRCPDRMKPPEFGRVPYVKQLKCIMAAGTLKEVKECDGRRSSL
jgi:hypothetical protein